MDDQQRLVVEHSGGPLLVLAGPGTGKTTAIVEAVVHRVAARKLDPARILVLTFSRKAAAELRERITIRLNRTTRAPLALTFHSYAYAVVRREFVLAGDEPPRLLSAPEQLLEVRRLLRGEVADGGSGWPERLRPALATRGFAAELRDFLLRASERGLDAPRLARLARERGRDDWTAAARFLGSYAGRFDLAPVPAYDYAEIIRIAGALLSRVAVRERERQAYDVVLVDEYQDCDPAQEQLLRSLAGDGRELIAVGDPDQSIYGFRGADPDAIRRFPETFRAPDGRPAKVVALATCRRSGPGLLAASRRVAARLPAALGNRNIEEERSHRGLAALPGAEPGSVSVLLASSVAQESALIADALRRAHLVDGTRWSTMAVLVRSAVRQAPALQRALAAAGVPAVTTGDELPLAAEPGTRPLVTLLRCAAVPAELDGQTADELLTGPLGGTDAIGLRRLRRALRAAQPPDPPRQTGDAGPPDPLAAALLDSRELALAALPRDVAGHPAAAAARKVAGLLALARRTASTGTPHEVLWAVWQRSGLAGQWQAASAAGGTKGAAADADLDAVLALFDAAARFSEQFPHGTLRLFLDGLAGQEIAGDRLAEGAAPGEAVSILTAHRSKGLEWDLVVVAGVQEGTWPDLRLRGSLLGVDELVEAAAGRAAGLPADIAAAAISSKLLAEERRLFYVAVTRARRKLVVTAVAGEDRAERPSRFLAELAGDEIAIERPGAAAGEPAAGAGAYAMAVRRFLSLPALTAELRRTAADRGRPAALREAAAVQLARLARAGVRGASPAHWYALIEPSSTAPVFSGEVRLSPSQAGTFTTCGLRWLLESVAGARRPGTAGHFGTVIHAAAAWAADGADETEIAKRIDEIWPHLDFGSAWYSARQRERAAEMVRKFLDWHRANPRKLLAVERDLRVRAGNVEIVGRVDRLEADGRGAVIVVDLKTGATPVPDDELDRHPQLGIYQLAVALGAFADLGLTKPGGAELVQLGGRAARSARVQRQQALDDDPEPRWADDLVRQVADGMAGSVFQARLNPHCRSCPVQACCPVHEHGAQVTP
jgi:superfamily I DNA/RNA helicase/RecB family exonuclease